MKKLRFFGVSGFGVSVFRGFGYFDFDAVRFKSVIL